MTQHDTSILVSRLMLAQSVFWCLAPVHITHVESGFGLLRCSRLPVRVLPTKISAKLSTKHELQALPRHIHSAASTAPLFASWLNLQPSSTFSTSQPKEVDKNYLTWSLFNFVILITPPLQKVGQKCKWHFSESKTRVLRQQKTTVQIPENTTIIELFFRARRKNADIFPWGEILTGVMQSSGSSQQRGLDGGSGLEKSQKNVVFVRTSHLLEVL